MAHTLLTYEERKTIEKELIRKRSCRQISKTLHRHHTVISREVRNNSGDHLPYSADRAQLHSERRLKGKKTSRLQSNPLLKEIVVHKLRQNWSPEQIGGWLKHECDDPPGHVSYETIYQYIYSTEGKQERLWLSLRTSRPKRRPHGSRKRQSDRIPGRVSIHHRPAAVDNKDRPGDWERDTIESPRKHQGALSVQYERKTQLSRIHKLISKKAGETNQAITQTIDSLPLWLIKTITFDNGSENVKHGELKKNFGIETYFCDPYCSWQKGGVENLNKLIRQYFPKGTDFSKVSEEEVYEVQEKLNNRPRKSLNYKTPNQILAELTGGATDP